MASLEDMSNDELRETIHHIDDDIRQLEARREFHKSGLDNKIPKTALDNWEKLIKTNRNIRRKEHRRIAIRRILDNNS